MLVPSIDLMNGKAVQLIGGRDKVLEVEDVLALAVQWRVYGEIAVIDLDAAMGKGDNVELVKKLCKVAACRVGGGIRSMEKAHEMLRAGAARVIIGSAASEDLLKKIPKDRSMVAIDQRNGKLQSQGWQKDEEESLFDRVKRLSDFCGGFLMTAVDKEGRLGGVDWDLIQSVKAITQTPITYAGGVTTVEEVVKLDKQGLDAQVGMALYQKRLDPTEAFLACLDWAKQGDLIPAIAQDGAGRIRMMAWESRESLRLALNEGKGIYWSRSRSELWEKGKSSGNAQELLRVEADCDRDTLRFLIRQTGPSCHTGAATCFGNGDFKLEDLEQTLFERRDQAEPGSYTAKLFHDAGMLASKLREETEEVIDARTQDEVVWEAADLLYFLMVRCAKADVRLEQVLKELERRRKTDARKPIKPLKK